MNEIVKNLMVVSVRNGVEISIEQDNVPALVKAMEQGGVVKIDKNIINTKDIIGIFTPEEIEAVIRKKNGQWQKNGKWYNKGESPCPYHPDNIIPFGFKCGKCQTG